MENQTAQIKAALDRGEKLTPLEALVKYRCFRLGARIWDLRQEGYPVEKVMVERGQSRVAMYWKADAQA